MEILKQIAIQDANLFSSNVSESDYPAYNAGTTYGLGDLVIEVSANKHYIYRSAVASNLNHLPSVSPTQWVNIGSTNRWKMFDQYINTQTENVGTIDVTMQTLQRYDGLFLGNIDADTVQIIIRDAANVIKYNQTFTTTKTNSAVGFWSFFFGEKVRVRDLYVNNLPYYATGKMQIIMTKATGTAKCGVCVIGKAMVLGVTEHGLKMGIADYSVRDTNEFGQTYIKQRPYSKTNDITFYASNNDIDTISEVLSDYRSTPCVFISSMKYTLSQVYGFYQEFEIVVAYPTHSLIAMKIQGLI